MNSDNDQRLREADSAGVDTPSTLAGAQSQIEATRQFSAVAPVQTHPVGVLYGGSEHYGQLSAPGHSPAPQHLQGPLPGLQVAPEAAAQLGMPTAVQALSSVAARGVGKLPPQRGWRHALYTGTRINLGRSRDELYEQDLFARIRRNISGQYQIAVLGLKGGGGRTAMTVALGSLLAQVRGDRILAVDADPDCGNLAERASRRPEMSLSDLLADKDIRSYNDLRHYTVMNSANLETLASAPYTLADRNFHATDWIGIVEAVSVYYNLVLADCASGLFHSATHGVLSTVSGVIIVATASLDGARQAAITLDWLHQNGYQDLASRSCIVINHTTKGPATIDMKDLIAQFERHALPGRVIELPWDKHIATGVAIDFALLSSTYKRRIAELGAALSDDFGAEHVS